MTDVILQCVWIIDVILKFLWILLFDQVSQTLHVSPNWEYVSMKKPSQFPSS